MNKSFYRLDGRDYLRVKKVLNILNKEWLGPWMLAKGRYATIEAVWKLMNEKELNYETIEPVSDSPDPKEFRQVIVTCYDKNELVELIKHSMKESERLSKKALDWESLYHNSMECWYKEWGGSVESYADFLREYYDEALSQAFLTTISGLASEGIKVLESEKTVYHSSGYAGTLDVLSLKGIELCIGDFKTFASKDDNGKKKRVTLPYYEHCLQTEAYRRAQNEMNGKRECSGRWIFYLD